MLRKLLLNNLKTKFYFISKLQFPISKQIRILDIGVANNSCEDARVIWPFADYDAVDVIKPKSDLLKLKVKFHNFDLENEPNLIPLGPYDLIMINHVLEHLDNANEVFDLCLARLAEGGYLYCEFPNINSLESFESRFNYHFNYDSTHKNILDLHFLVNLAYRRNCKVLYAGKSTSPLKGMLSIPRFLINMLSSSPPGSATAHFSGKITSIVIKKL